MQLRGTRLLNNADIAAGRVRVLAGEALIISSGIIKALANLFAGRNGILITGSGWSACRHHG